MILIINFRRNPYQYRVADLTKAVALFERARDCGNEGEGFGASDMRRDCGQLFNDDGTHFGHISYNGVVWDVNDNEVEVLHAAP